MDSEDLPQKNPALNESDHRRVEETTLIVLQALERRKGSQGEQKSRFVRGLNLLSTNWAIVAFLLSIGFVLITWFAFGISPFYEQQRLKEKEMDLKRERARLAKINTLAAQHRDVGNTFLDAGDIEVAMEEYQRAADLDPGNPEYERELYKIDVFSDVEESIFASEFSKDAQDTSLARTRLSLLLKEYPSDSHVWAFQGDVVSYYDADEAMKDYRKAVAISPENAHAYGGMANLYYDRGMYEEYLEMAKKAYDLAPWDSSIQYRYAYALYLEERYQDAIAGYEALSLMDPLYMWAYHDLAQLYRLRGDLYSAQWYYEQFIAMLEDETVASLEKNQGVASFTTGPDSYPVNLYENPERRYYAYYSIALTSYLRGDTEVAESYVSKGEALQIDPTVKFDVKRLMEYDITLLEEKQKHFRSKTDDFEAKFLSS